MPTRATPPPPPPPPPRLLALAAVLLLAAAPPALALDLKALACRRVYSSEQAGNGSVASPGYPRPYPPATRCVYEFEGRPAQRVQLAFSDLSLHHSLDGGRHGPDAPHGDPDANAQACDEGADALVAYARVGERLHEIERFCGAAAPRPVMSSGPALTLEFRGLRAGSHARGFHATYAFLHNFGMTAGEQLAEPACAFAFRSSAALAGAFASPNFPGLYPRDAECHFLFHGAAGQRVRLRFAHFDVEGVRPCNDASASDFVELSNFYGPDRKYERKCGALAAFEVTSDRKFFRVTFRSNDRLDATGFNATYEFVSAAAAPPGPKGSRAQDARAGSNEVKMCYTWTVLCVWVISRLHIATI